jgi:hypothetical protein
MACLSKPLRLGSIIWLCANAAAGAHHRDVIVKGIRVSADPSQSCECRAKGKAFQQDEQICLNGRIATCTMDQNVTSWRMSERLCPEAKLNPVRMSLRLDRQTKL